MNLLKPLGIAIPSSGDDFYVRKPMFSGSSKKGWMVSRHKRRHYRASSKVRRLTRQIGGGLGAHWCKMPAGPSVPVVPCSL